MGQRVKDFEKFDTIEAKTDGLVSASAVAERVFTAPEMQVELMRLCGEALAFLKTGMGPYDNKGTQSTRDFIFSEFRNFKNASRQRNQLELISQIVFFQGLHHLILRAAYDRLIPMPKPDELAKLVKESARQLSQVLLDVDARHEEPLKADPPAVMIEKRAVLVMYADDGTKSRGLFRSIALTFVKYGLWTVDRVDKKSIEFSAGPLLRMFMEKVHEPAVQHIENQIRANAKGHNDA